METEPDQPTENSTAEEASDVVAAVTDDAAPPAEELKPSSPVVDELSDIKSYGDAVEYFTDGVEKLRESSLEDVKKTGLKVLNRVHKAWRKLVDGD